MFAFHQTPDVIVDFMFSLFDGDIYNATVLDTGAGYGVFTDKAIQYGFRKIYALEINPELCGKLTEKYKEVSYVSVICENYLKYNPENKYDLIIGNPPYIHYNELDEENKMLVNNITGNKQSDIYYAFIIKSINNLKEGGQLIYIVPYTFLYNTYARNLRLFMQENGRLELVIDLNEVKIFQKASPEVVIFKYVRDRSKKGNTIFFEYKKNTVKYLDCFLEEVKSYLKYSDTIFSSEHGVSYEKNIFDFDNVNIFVPRDYYYLREIARVGVAPVSGYDEAYMVSEEFYSSLPENEKSLVKKFVKSSDCISVYTYGSALYIYIYNIKSEDEFIEKYPVIYEHLLQYKNMLVRRYRNNRQWYEWQALRNHDFLISNIHREKIYVPAITRREPVFTIGAANLMPASDVIFISPYKQENIKKIQDYLNSKEFIQKYKQSGYKKGGRLVFTQKILSSVEIPRHVLL